MFLTDVVTAFGARKSVDSLFPVLERSCLLTKDNRLHSYLSHSLNLAWQTELEILERKNLEKPQFDCDLLLTDLPGDQVREFAGKFPIICLTEDLLLEPEIPGVSYLGWPFNSVELCRRVKQVLAIWQSSK